jgi:hypothetical protein
VVHGRAARPARDDRNSRKRPFYTQSLPAAVAPHAGQPATPKTGLYRVEHIPPAAPIHGGHRAAFVVVIVGLALVLLVAVLPR